MTWTTLLLLVFAGWFEWQRRRFRRMILANHQLVLDMVMEGRREARGASTGRRLIRRGWRDGGEGEYPDALHPNNWWRLRALKARWEAGHLTGFLFEEYRSASDKEGGLAVDPMSYRVAARYSSDYILPCVQPFVDDPYEGLAWRNRRRRRTVKRIAAGLLNEGYLEPTGERSDRGAVLRITTKGREWLLGEEKARRVGLQERAKAERLAESRIEEDET